MAEKIAKNRRFPMQNFIQGLIFAFCQKNIQTRRPLSSEIFSARTVLQLHKFEAQGYLMHYKNAKKFEEKKASIYLCPVVKETSLF